MDMNPTFNAVVNLSIPEKSLIPLNIPVLHPQKLLNSDSTIHILCSYVDTESKLNVEIEEYKKKETRRRRKEIFKIFNIDEEYLHYFSCIHELIFKGKIYITNNHLLFNSPFKQKVISIESIKSIERCKRIKMFTAAINIELLDGSKVSFKFIRRRSEFIATLLSVMKLKGKEIQVIESNDCYIEDDEARADSSLNIPEQSDDPVMKSELSKSSSKRRRNYFIPSFLSKSAKSKSHESLNDPSELLSLQESDSSISDEVEKEKQLSMKLKNSLLYGDTQLYSGEEESDVHKIIEKSSESTLAFTASEHTNNDNDSKIKEEKVDVTETIYVDGGDKRSKRKSLRRRKRKKQQKDDLDTSSYDDMKSNIDYCESIPWFFKAILIIVQIFVSQFLLSIFSIPILSYRYNIKWIYFFSSLSAMIMSIYYIICLYIALYSQSILKRTLTRRIFNKKLYFVFSFIIHIIIFTQTSKIMYFISKSSPELEFTMFSLFHLSKQTLLPFLIWIIYIYTSSFTCFVLIQRYRVKYRKC